MSSTGFHYGSMIHSWDSFKMASAIGEPARTAFRAGRKRSMAVVCDLKSAEETARR